MILVLKNEELLNILKIVNLEKGNIVQNEILEQVLSCVILNSLDDERLLCQDRIKVVIENNVKRSE